MIQMNKHSLIPFHLLKPLAYYVYEIPFLCCYFSETKNNSCFIVVKDLFDFTGFYIYPIVTSIEEMDFLFHRRN